ncbi:MAG: OmpA family protein [Flavobacteriales bacterium]|nr:OmpA family protein [Flavobacteriales bacterium]
MLRDPILRSLIVFLCLPMVAMGQMRDYTTKDKKAIKLYEEGSAAMHRREWRSAEAQLAKAAAFDERFVEPRFALAELCDMQDRDTEAMKWYREAIALAPKFFPSAYLHLADIEFRNQELEAAEMHYRTYLELEQEPMRRARAQLGIQNCAFVAQALKSPVPFEPMNLGPGVNSANGEYYPCLTADDATLLFTRDLPDERSPWGHQEDFYVSRRGEDRSWSDAVPVTEVITAGNEGAGTLSPDGRFIIFTACAGLDGDYGGGRQGMGSCDLFISRRMGGRWSKPENLGPPVNSRNWESQPSLGSDGRTLYFVRGQQAADGIKSMDIFMSRLGPDGAFSAPERLPASVNTLYQEESVQIHPDGRTLYFSSNGHPGFGGLDIYVSRMQEDGTWGQALNLGWPINSGSDENSLQVNAEGNIAYFASDRKGGYGDLDLYSFELYAEARPTPVGHIRGRVTDRSTGGPLEADVELFDVATGALATAAYSDPVSGEFLVCLPKGRKYALNASSTGYLFYSETYDLSAATLAGPVELDVPLEPLTSGHSIALRNIFFPTASHELLPESNAELDKLQTLLELNPSVRVELSGHTDDVGSEDDNLALSEARARAVRDHLVANGIDPARIEARGYGETKPVAPNTNEEGRALNRRTEVTVL